MWVGWGFAQLPAQWQLGFGLSLGLGSRLLHLRLFCSLGCMSLSFDGQTHCKGTSPAMSAHSKLVLASCCFVFLFCIFDALALGALLTLEGLPLPGLANSWRQWIAKFFQHAFHMQTDIEAIPLTISSMKFLHSWPIFPCSNHPRARCQTTRNNTEPTETIKNSQSAYAASPVPSHRNHNKDCAHIFPLFLLLPDWPWVACGVAYLLFLRSVSEQTLSSMAFISGSVDFAIPE